MQKYLFNLTFILFLIFSSSVVATNGVVEINQACVAIGCFAGDDPNYPVTIDGTAGKSYRLTSDLVVPDKDTTGIIINSRYVTIDLNGFSIIRSGCHPSSFCSPSASSGANGYGIYSNWFYSTVKNGYIIGMGRAGVKSTNFSNIQGVNSLYNAEIGIEVRDMSIISRNSVNKNGLDGIYSGFGSTINENTIYQNGNNGVYCTLNCIVSNNNIYSNNGTYGISVSTGSNVFNNSIRSNGTDGIKFNNNASAYSSNTISGHTNVISGLGVDKGGNLCLNSSNAIVTCPTSL